MSTVVRPSSRVFRHVIEKSPSGIPFKSLKKEHYPDLIKLAFSSEEDFLEKIAASSLPSDFKACIVQGRSNPMMRAVQHAIGMPQAPSIDDLKNALCSFLCNELSRNCFCFK